jgi:hypothetical protein
MRIVFVSLLVSLTACAQGVKTAIEDRIAEHIIEHRKDLLTAKPQEGITRGSVTGQATAPGFDHPDELAAEGQRYQKVLEKYPIQIKVGFSGN